MTQEQGKVVVRPNFEAMDDAGLRQFIADNPAYVSGDDLVGSREEMLETASLVFDRKAEDVPGARKVVESPYAVGQRVSREIDIEKPELGEKFGRVTQSYSQGKGRFYGPEVYAVQWEDGSVERGFFRHGLTPISEEQQSRKVAENEGKVPLTGALLSFISAMQGCRKVFIDESSMADSLGLPKPKDWHTRCEELFFNTYKVSATQIGLTLNKQTFEAVLRTQLTDEMNSTVFDDLPKKFMFDPWAGMGYGGIVSIEPQTPSTKANKPKSSSKDLGM